MPQDDDLRAHIEDIIAEVVEAEGQTLIGYRDVPVDNSSLSKAPDIVATEPHHRQVFIGRNPEIEDEREFERRLFILRKVISNRIFKETDGRDNGFYIVIAVEPNDRLQGYVPGLPARRLLSGPARRAVRIRACPGAPALLHQHLSVLEACPPIPDGGAQW